ncbi:VOC family protein [uncultured Paludibaculum sp.]|uniref:VOC family protein n=1 Tax=uncultured Paludibaculum sp. TaxID=1765020 RepID=UPI002AAB34E7|nr:VOC family protein [uncultured Paludibaculum sp.]
MRRLPLCLLLACLIPVFGQTPDFYRQTPRLMWVVRDAQATADAWEKAGVPHDGDLEPYQAAKVELRGRPGSHKFSMLSGYFGNLRADWIQPVKGNSAWKEFLDKRGPGVFGLMFRVPSMDELVMEAARLQSLGVTRLEEGVFEFDQGWKVPYVMLDTAGEGKYTLCLYYDPEPDPAPDSRGPQVAQLALIAKDLSKVSAYWTKLGFAPIVESHSEIREKVYKGAPGRFEMKLAFQRQFPIAMEWIQPVVGPSIYEDQLAGQGEGFQHLAFDAKDLETESARWRELGFPATMSGTWGEKGAAGSGRFAYHDLHAAGGVDVELLWNYATSAARTGP